MFPENNSSKKLIKKPIEAIVLHEYKAVYWWLPKNACTSFKGMFSKLLKIDNPDNVHAAPFEEIFSFNEFPEYLHFAIVRDPASRLYSLWDNKIGPKTLNNIFFENGVHYIFKRYGKIFYGGMTFMAFVDAIMQIPHEEADCHFMPQHLQIPQSNIRIMKLENINEETPKLFNILDINLKLTHKNRSSSNITEEMISELPDAFYNYYSIDYSTYNY